MQKSSAYKKILTISTGLVVLLFIYFITNKNEIQVPADNIGIEQKEVFTADDMVTEKILQENKDYTIEANIPQIEDTGDSFAKQFINRQIKESVDGLIKEFTDEVEIFKTLGQNSQTGIFSSGANLPKHSLVISVAGADYALDRYLSIELKDFSYMSGSTHPYTRTITLNFDLKDGKMISIKDISKDYQKFLDEISRISKAHFSQVLTSFFEEGVLPREENFKSFLIKDDGIRFIFDQYQVAPYASGEHDLFIRHDAFRGLLNLSSH
jgi:hypothetical protein